MAKRKWKLKKQDKLLQEMQATEKLDFNLKLKDLVLPIGVLLLIGIIKVSCEAIPSMLVDIDQFTQEAKQKQIANTYYIEGETLTTRNPESSIFEKNNFKNIYNSDLWYFESQEYLDKDTISPDKIVAFFDRPNLYTYFVNADEKKPHLFGPDGVIYGEGNLDYQEDLKHDKDTTLEQSVNRRNYLGNCLIHWYDSTCDANYNYWDKNETPKITKITKDCVYIKFSENREACVSKEYGIATYYKQKTTAPNEEVIHETTVTELKDKFKDGYRFDFSTLEIPQDKKLKTEEEFHNEQG